MKTPTKWLKNKAVAVAAVIVILGTVGVFYFKGGSQKIEEIAVKKGIITQEVSVTGKTKPAESVNLAFEKSGRIARADIKIGDKISAGEVLVALNTSDLAAELAQDQANLEAQQAKLEQLKRGTRPEEIRIEEVKVDNAYAALGDARQNLVDKLQDAFTKSDDAVRNKVDQLFSNARSNSPRLSYDVDSQLKNAAEQQRAKAESILNSWQPAVDSLNADSDLDSAVSQSKDNLSQVKSFLNTMTLVLNSLKPNTTLTQSTIDVWRSDISSGRNNVNTAVNNLSQAEEKLRSAYAELTLAENQLALKEAGTVAEEISAQEAAVKQAAAKVATSQATLAKAALRAPIGGTITKQDAKVGEIAPANVVLVSIISESNLEIESNVPEVDIGKLQVSDPVKITLDAFPGENFSGRVAYIDPAETIIDGVVNFKVTVLFDRLDSRFKSGLTANLDIETIKKTDVLILPQFAIVENDQGTFVKKVENGATKELPVKTGVRSQDGLVEIVSGLNEGDKVLNIGFKAQ